MSDPATASTPAHLMELFAQLALAGDVDALMSLYEPDAVFQPQPGVSLRGPSEIRPAIAQLAALHPRISSHEEPDVVVVGDLALVSNEWTMTAQAPDGTHVEQRGVSADLLRRQPDGSWLVLIDQPRGTTMAT